MPNNESAHDIPQPGEYLELKAEELEKITPEKEEKAEEPPIQRLVKEYDLSDRMEESLDTAKENFAKDQAKMDELRKQQGIATPRENSTVGGRALKELVQDKQKIESKIKNLEKKSLGVPDEFEGQPEEHISAINNPPEIKNFETQMTSLETEVSGIEDSVEKELQKERKLFVQKFIEDSTKEMLEEFKFFIDETENAEQARGLVALKINHDVGKAAKQFIEEGGEPDFGFEMELAGAEYDTPDGKTQKFVTEITLEIPGVQKTELSENKELKNVNLLTKEQDQELKVADNNGELEKTEV